MQRDRVNARYLPGVRFPEDLHVEPDLDAALARCDDLLIAVPSQTFRAVLTNIAPHLRKATRVAWATKGFEQATGLLPFAVASEVLGGRHTGGRHTGGRPLAVLSGPTFAREVGAGLPTAMVIASPDTRFAQGLARNLSGPTFRAYTQPDIVGVEVGGAVKNVIAISTGIADGVGYGANTRVALITRGLAEMMRLGVKLGAARDTFMGLAGLGDLVLTCTDDQSRNRRFGVALGRGASREDAERGIGQVVEGVFAARAVHEVAQKLAVDMPICAQVYRVMYEARPIKEAVEALMSRGVRAEGD
jgi:glycerol-3-phosphate dehydrogenase (NAD(P)+)